MKPLSNRIALVTGASRGIGRAVSYNLAEAGAHIIAVARSAESLNALSEEIHKEGGSCTPCPMDLSDENAIIRLKDMISRKWGRLDILIGNAGLLGEIAPLPNIASDIWSQTMQINVTANFYLLKHLDPLLQKSDAGRIVFITSGAAYKCSPAWGIYSVSKSALEALAKTYANENKDNQVKVMLLSPGPIRTDMRAKAAPDEDPMTLRTPQDLVPHILKMVLPQWTETGKIYDFPAGGIIKEPGIPYVKVSE